MALNVGLIGCGKVVSYGHMPALTALEDVNVVALADVTEARRKIGQDWFSLPDNALYEDYKDLLARDDVEAVVVTVPQAFRHNIVLDAIAAGKHILSEKPIATTPAIGAELIAAAKTANLKFGMVHNYVFLPEFSLMKRLLLDNRIGKLRMATLHFLGVIDYAGAQEYREGNWRHDPTMSGGGVMMDMIHAVYLAEWLYDEAATQVMAFVDAPEYADDTPVVEDLALAQVAFPSGYAAIHMGWGEGVGGIDLTGSDGQMRARYEQNQTSGFNRAAELYSVDTDWERLDYVMDNLPTHAENIARSFTQLWQDFDTAIRLDLDPVMPAETGLRALEITLGAYLSGLTGRVVTLPLEPGSPVYERGIAGLAEVEAWEGSRTKHAGLFGTR